MNRILKVVGVLGVVGAATTQRKWIVSRLVHLLTRVSGTWVGSPNG
jgi:hypothetical protein